MAQTVSTSPRAPDSLLGQIVGERYQLLELVGRGGMGAVYEAIQLDLGRRVAVKVLLEVDSDGLARFRQEALANASINHPHVVHRPCGAYRRADARGSRRRSSRRRRAPRREAVEHLPREDAARR